MNIWSRRSRNLARMEDALRLLREGHLDEAAQAFRRLAGTAAGQAVPPPERDPAITGSFSVVRREGHAG
jgi:hypothetical protein